MDSERMAIPSPRMARSATAPGALAWSVMSSTLPAAAHAWSNTVLTPVPSGMQTIEYPPRSARATRARPTKGWTRLRPPSCFYSEASRFQPEHAPFLISIHAFDQVKMSWESRCCLLYTSDAADEEDSVDL